jgi:hypothetical protein
MKRALLSFILALTLFLLGGAAPLSQAAPQAAAPTRVSHLPLITGAPAQIQTEPILLLEKDTGYLNAVRAYDVAGGEHYYLVIMQRPAHQAAFYEDIDGTLVPLSAGAASATLSATLAISWEPVGEKQGSLIPIPVFGGLRLYYTSRPEGATSGPFYVYRDEIPIEGIVP